MPRSRNTDADETASFGMELGSRARVVAGVAAVTVVTAVPTGAIATFAVISA